MTVDPIAMHALLLSIRDKRFKSPLTGALRPVSKIRLISVPRTAKVYVMAGLIEPEGRSWEGFMRAYRLTDAGVAAYRMTYDDWKP